MKKKLHPFTLSVSITAGLALGVWLTGTIPVAGQQTTAKQPVHYSTAGQPLSAPVRVSFNPPATAYPMQNPMYPGQNGQVRQPVSSSGKMQFAFSKKSGQQAEVRSIPVAPAQPNPNQIAAKRRQSGKHNNSGSQTAVIPYRSPILTNPAQTNALQVPTQAMRTPVPNPVNRPQAQASPQPIARPSQLLSKAMASGQYDGYLVVSDQEYMLMKQGRTPQIDPNRVRSFASKEVSGQLSRSNANSGNASYSPVADYEDMIDRMEFSLAKLPGSPRAVALSPPSSASVWNRFLTGRQSDEIRSWKNNYVELVQHRATAPTKQRFDGVPALPDTMIAQAKPVKPVEMKRLNSKTPRVEQEEFRLVSGEVTQDMLPEYRAPKPLHIEDENDQAAQLSETQVEPDEPTPSGKMKVYRPED
ncbi:MAG: hypothetical protein Q4G59_01955 [Planctomycetia bacterium]|nr:hypothetical protein [Planctomycetia bacterium]